MWLDPKVSAVENEVISHNAQGGGLITGLSYPGGPIHLTQSGYFTEYEVLDTVNGSHKEWHECQHYRVGRFVPSEPWSYLSRYTTTYDPDNDNKWWVNTTRAREFLWTYGSGTGSGLETYGAWNDPVLGLQTMYEDNLMRRGVTLIPVKIKRDLCDKALSALMPGIRPKLSLVNSILELKDFKSLPRTIANIRNLSRTLLSGKGPWGNRTLRRIIGAGADVYLQQQFNISPLLSDIAGIKSTIQNVRKEIQNLLENEGKLRTRHFRAELKNHLSDEPLTWTGYKLIDTWANSSSSDAKIRFGRSVKHSGAMFHATLQYRYDLDPWARETAQLRGFLDSLGVNANPAIIWNAIPWSFVVDWVINVSGWLSRFAERNLEPRVHITRFMASAQAQRTIRTFHTWKYPDEFTPPVDSGDVASFVQEEKAYIRWFPSTELHSWFQTSGLSSHEFSLGAALIAVRGNH